MTKIDLLEASNSFCERLYFDDNDLIKKNFIVLLEGSVLIGLKVETLKLAYETLQSNDFIEMFEFVKNYIIDGLLKEEYTK